MNRDVNCEKVFTFAKSRFIINIQVQSDELESPFPEEEGDVWTLYTRSNEARPGFKKSACFRYKEFKEPEKISKFMPSANGLRYSGLKLNVISTKENKEEVVGVIYEVK
jgi:hypothetical protein